MKFSNNYFATEVEFKTDSVIMMLRVDEDICHTNCFEDVVPFLHTHIPGVLHTKCYNPLNVSFREEVLNTEFGHLFEHMLITVLCDEVIKAGGKSARYQANTSWDWHKNPRGTFEITIDAAIDPILFALAFKKTAVHATTLCDQRIKTKAAVALATAAPSSVVLES